MGQKQSHPVIAETGRSHIEQPEYRQPFSGATESEEYG